MAENNNVNEEITEEQAATVAQVETQTEPETVVETETVEEAETAEESEPVEESEPEQTPELSRWDSLKAWWLYAAIPAVIGLVGLLLVLPAVRAMLEGKFWLGGVLLAGMVLSAIAAGITYSLRGQAGKARTWAIVTAVVASLTVLGGLGALAMPGHGHGPHRERGNGMMVEDGGRGRHHDDGGRKEQGKRLDRGQRDGQGEGFGRTQ